MMTSVIEQNQVSPPLRSDDKMIDLPLTYFDMIWLHFYCMRRILFYDFPNISRTTFINNIIPSLKHSLSLALGHYAPLAGSALCPPNGLPTLRYVPTEGALPLTFCETTADFSSLIGNHPRKAKDFYHFIPKLEEAKEDDAVGGLKISPLLAIQVTLFPNHGISIGFTNHHVVGDGATIVGFIRAWATLNKFSVQQLLSTEIAPFYDRSVIKDPHGVGKLLWDELHKAKKLDVPDIGTPPDNSVRTTFTITRDDIIKLKTLALSRRPNATHVTSFTVTCAYVWACMIKSDVAQETDENGTEFFGCAADCRARFNPPIPPNYFGNCIIGYVATAKHADLAGKEGFAIAVESIGEAIHKRSNDEAWILSGEWLKIADIVDRNRTLSVAGSPRLDLYAADFGWGRPQKLEFISIDNDAGGISMSLNNSRDSEGGLEIGLSLPIPRMNAFAAIFTHGLSFL